MSPLTVNPTRKHATARRGLRRVAVWPIRNEADYDLAVATIGKLALRGELTSAQEARLEILSTLVEAYDREHHRIDTSGMTPLRALQSLMMDHEMNASDLGRLLGSRALGSLILNGRRELSKAQIKTLARHFAVSSALFL